MKTPIKSFVRRYSSSGAMRLHMPGHKGIGDMEALDITEIGGADSLYEAEGIIAESEANASQLFGCPTYYSAEGSSQCIKTMLYLAAKDARSLGKAPLVLAGRNVHKAFVSAVALSDIQVEWIYGDKASSYLSCEISPAELEALIDEKDPCAVYITSPDYLGCVADIKALASVCRKKGVKLLVDNAHGAYLKFLPESAHPMDLGAYMCCDSAHKTLPVLTGGAYLHTNGSISSAEIKNAMVLFGSTSPSYLILQSLDMANEYLNNGYAQRLAEFSRETEMLKSKLISAGYLLMGDEALKLCICPKSYGYTGCELSEILEQKGIVCEFADKDHLVLMLTPEITSSQLKSLYGALTSVTRKEPISEKPPKLVKAEQAMSVRSALFAKSCEIEAAHSCGRILADLNVGCPPAVPIAVCGEVIGKEALDAFEYYGIKKCRVVSE